MKLKDLLESGIGPKSNGVITKEDMIYIFLGFNTEEDQEDDKLIVMKLDEKAAYISEVLSIETLNKETVENSLEASEYTSFEDLTITENFVIFSLLKAFEGAINVSENPDRPFADTIIPALLDMLHLAVEEVKNTKEGIKELAALAEKKVEAKAERESLESILSNLGIEN